MAVCYRHPDRETGVSCSNCGRPICPDCMTSTSVGMRCPECSRETTKVMRPPSIAGVRPEVTIVLIAICVLVWFGLRASTRGSVTVDEFDLAERFVADGEWWRLITSGFTHVQLFHLGFNMYMLWFLGGMLEPDLGKPRFIGLYFASLLAGSLGVILLNDGDAIGASGAVFGLLGAALVIQYRRGVDVRSSGLLPLLVLNLVITFVPFFNIAKGAHLGGLAAGLLLGFVLEELRRRRLKPVYGVAACAVVAVAAFVASIVLAQPLL